MNRPPTPRTPAIRLATAKSRSLASQRWLTRH